MYPHIFLLKSGSIQKDEFGNILDARSSVTLVVSGSKKIIVDTGLKAESGLIIDALFSKGLTPGDIDVVVNTHSHPDHKGNNYLFSNAKFIAPHEGKIIAPHVAIMETPGHTLDSISIRVEVKNVVVIAGDALPTFNNFLKNIPPSLNDNRYQAISSMNKIIRNAKIIIPGHDNPFSIAEKRYITFTNQV